MGKVKKVLTIAIAAIMLLSMLALTLGPVSASELGLVGHWKFDEGSGDVVYDSSGYGNDGTLINNPAWVDGKFGKALSFDGVDDYVEVLDDPSLNFGIGNFSVELWFKGPKQSDYLALKVDGDTCQGWWLEARDTVISFQTYNAILDLNPTAECAFIYDDNNWHHVVAIHEDDFVRLYIDGVLKAEETGAAGVDVNNTWGLFIGGHLYWSQPFHGFIDEVRIYNRALSADEIWAHYAEVAKPRATVDIDPDTLNLKSRGKWITAYIELPEGYDVADIDITTVELRFGGESVKAELWPTEIGDYDGDEAPDLMVKFDRQAVQGIVSEGNVELTVTGELSSGPVEMCFEGSDTIRAIMPGQGKGPK